MHRTGRWKQVEARVVRQREQGAGHLWLEIEVPKGFETPVAGQFVQLLLPEVKRPVLLGRPMSVAGVRRSKGALVLGFLYAPVGAGTHALAALSAGDTLEVLGPLGQGYPLKDSGMPVLAAGGRGVAPLLFAAAALARTRRPYVFVFGARTRSLLVGVADARARIERTGGTLHLCTDDGSRGSRGNVVGVLDKLKRKHDGPFVIHSCGPHGMLKAVAHWALKHDARAHLAMESVMACGTGVCRGCPLPRSPRARASFDPATTPSLFGNQEFAMCCTEGPVFEAADLDWSRIE